LEGICTYGDEGCTQASPSGGVYLCYSDISFFLEQNDKKEVSGKTAGIIVAVVISSIGVFIFILFLFFLLF
jgi:hypothetical protein